MSPSYQAGYFCGVMGMPAIANPWPPFWPRERREWALGHSYGVADSTPPVAKAQLRLEPECVR